MQRVLEPEVMDSWEEAVEYDAMDFTEINAAFAQRAIELGTTNATVLDAGTGTARIPILIGRKCPQWQIIGIDMAESMLQIGRENVEEGGLEKQITLEFVDAKNLPYQDGQFDMVISNSLFHHLPNPLPFLQELKRVLKPQGAIFIRDLIRPPSEEIMNSLVESIGKEYDKHQKRLFRDSLHAAFTLDEVQDLVQQAGLEGVTVERSSDRHWSAERAWVDPA
ncbi:class I SAM-dependent methyltransferase [Coleofasciculus sp. FACHB-1120]|uniref:class I SAM-dependent methyltransferase n=1 Tax=Coleofasciculus sp. FACHB-1120 TaxID=2692783 RepID=UPI001689A5C1|nr:class I SAM-dependent methyltransferase [Coleofasciculus sp. FACHB-1120]MBD2742457.1 class I SAM-dependent methyltransferase [Coleofasciculus sp. FACHB-1120]